MINFFKRVLKSKFLANIVWSFSGLILPMMTALIMIPIIIKNIGLEPFGVFSLIIMLIGAMTLFDFGFTRSVTHITSKYYHQNCPEDYISSVKCGWVLLLLFSILISILTYYFSKTLTELIIRKHDDLIYPEILLCIKITALTLPFVMSQTVFSSVLESMSAFKKSNIYRTPFWMAMYLLPALVSFFSKNIAYLTISVFFVRISMAILFFYLMRNEISKFTNLKIIHAVMKRSICLEIISYGGWIALGNIIVPVMLYLDRFIVASVVGPVNYPYFGTPYEVISRITIITTAVCGVLFPLLSGKIKSDLNNANKHYWISILSITLITLPIMVIGITFSKELLSFWINPEFSKHAWLIFSLLLIGFFIYGAFQPSFMWIMAAGKPWITTIIQVIDLLSYIIYLPIITKHYGIEGAAIAWDLRMFCGLVLMFYIRNKMYSTSLLRLNTAN